nr:hypothetical protein CFP56_44431 [Quercus suber]
MLAMLAVQTGVFDVIKRYKDVGLRPPSLWLDRSLRNLASLLCDQNFLSLFVLVDLVFRLALASDIHHRSYIFLLHTTFLALHAFLQWPPRSRSIIRCPHQVRGQRSSNPSRASLGQFSPISPDDERLMNRSKYYSESSGSRKSTLEDQRSEQQPQVVTQGSNKTFWSVPPTDVHESPSPPSHDLYHVPQTATATTTALEVDTMLPAGHWVLSREMTPQHTPQDAISQVEVRTGCPGQAVETYSNPQSVTPSRKRTPRTSNAGPSQWESPQSRMPPPPPKTALFTPAKAAAPRATNLQAGNLISPIEDPNLPIHPSRQAEMSSARQDPLASLPWLETQFFDFDPMPPTTTASFTHDEPSMVGYTPALTSTGPPSTAIFDTAGLGIQDVSSFSKAPTETTQYYFTESNTAMPILVASDGHRQSPAQPLYPSAALSSVGMRMLMPQDDLYSPPSTIGNPHPRKRKRLLQPAPSPIPDRRRPA